MSKEPLKLEDFNGLTVPQYAEKLQGTTNVDFLSELEKIENSQANPRKGVLSAINERQGILIDEKQKADSDTPTIEGETKDEEVLTNNNADEVISSEKGMFEDETGTSEDVQKATDPIAEDSVENIENISIDETEDRSSDNEGVSNKTDGSVSGDTDNDDEGKSKEGLALADDEQPIQSLDQVLEGETVGPAPTEEEIYEMIYNTLKRSRLKLDALYQFCKAHNGITSTPDNALFLAKCWLGKALGELGLENPYHVEGGVKDASQIPPTADKNEGTEFQMEITKFKNRNALPAVIELREQLDAVANDLRNINHWHYGRDFSLCRSNAWSKICEAKFELGEILSNMRR